MSEDGTRHISKLPFAAGIRRLQMVEIPDIQITVSIKNSDEAVFVIQYEGFWSLFFAPHITGTLRYQTSNQNMVVDYKLKPFGTRLPQLLLLLGVCLILLIPMAISAGLTMVVGLPLVMALLLYFYYPFFKDNLFQEQRAKLDYYLNHLLELKDVSQRMDVWMEP